MGDKDARMPGITGTAYETQHAFGLVDTEVVGGFIEDDQVALKVQSPGQMATACRSPPDSATDWGSSWRNFFRNADLLEQPTRHLIHRVSDPADQGGRGPFTGSRPRNRIASDRELGHQRRVLVDRPRCLER